MRKVPHGMQSLVEEWELDGGTWPVDPTEFGEWAVRTRRWEPTHEASVRLCAELFSRAMRETYATDPKGRRIRTRHAVREKRGHGQFVLWYDLATAPRDKMIRAFQQRRDQIVGDCRQLKNDVDSYNEARPEAQVIQLVLDFTLDMEELELAA